MKTLFYFGFLCCFAMNSSSQEYLVDVESLGTYDMAYMEAVLSLFGTTIEETGIEHEVEVFKIHYNTLNPDGTPTIASGAICVPLNYSCPLPLASYSHGTISLRTDVPSHFSQEINLGIAFAGMGNVVSLSDYLGLGDHQGIHPYVHAESEATATIDCMRATREFCEQESIALSGQVFLYGYSQGGHAAMAAHKMIHDQFADEFDIAAAAPMSGPYDVSGVQTATITEDVPYATPGYLPYVVYAYQQVYEYLPQDLSDIFIAPYDTLVPIWFDGTHGLGEINGLMPAIPNQIIIPEVLQAFKDDPEHPLRIALEDNDLYNWVPEDPILMCYCKGDDQVNYLNSEVAQEAFVTNGSTTTQTISLGDDLDHGGCVLPAMLAGRDFFDMYVDRSGGMSIQIISQTTNGTMQNIEVEAVDAMGAVDFTWSDGQSGNNIEVSSDVQEIMVTAIDERGCATTLTIETMVSSIADFASWGIEVQQQENYLVVTSEYESGTLTLYSVQGKVIWNQKMQSQNRINTNQIPAGIYLIQISLDNKRTITERVIIAR